MTQRIRAPRASRSASPLAMKEAARNAPFSSGTPTRSSRPPSLSSPKLTETEIEAIAKMASVSEDVLRIISNTRSWMKRYGVMAALARSQKTPIAISMNLLPRLTRRTCGRFRRITTCLEVLRITARQKIVLTRK